MEPPFVLRASNEQAARPALVLRVGFQHFRILNCLQHFIQPDSFLHHFLLRMLCNPNLFCRCLRPDLFQYNV